MYWLCNDCGIMLHMYCICNVVSVNATHNIMYIVYIVLMCCICNDCGIMLHMYCICNVIGVAIGGARGAKASPLCNEVI